MLSSVGIPLKTILPRHMATDSKDRIRYSEDEARKKANAAEAEREICETAPFVSFGRVEANDVEW